MTNRANCFRYDYGANLYCQPRNRPHFSLDLVPDYEMEHKRLVPPIFLHFLRLFLGNSNDKKIANRELLFSIRYLDNYKLYVKCKLSSTCSKLFTTGKC